MKKRKQFPIPEVWTGEWVQKFLDHKRWEQQDLAREMGYSPGAIYKWVHGERRISIPSQIKLDEVAAS